MSSKADNHADVLRYTPGACMLVHQGVILAANTEAVDTVGLALGQLIGIDFRDIIVGDFRSQVVGALDDADTDTTTLRTRLALGLRPVELTLRRLPDDKTIVGLRSTESEYHYSALAQGDLTHDQLTGLANRFHLLEQLQERMQARTRAPLAVIGLWVDDLPALAQSRGERIVDRVIKDVGQRLQGRLRGPDVLGRFEPAGFISVLTSDATVAQLAEIAGRLREEVAFPVEIDAGLVSFTASVAVGSLTDRKTTIETVMSKLDDAAERLSQGPGNKTEVLKL